MNVKTVGNTMIKLNNNDIEVKNVLHVPDLVANLLSVNKIVENGNSVIFNEKGCIIKNNKNETLAICKPENGVYKFQENKKMCLLTKNNTSAYTLNSYYRRLGHMNYQALLKMKNMKKIDFYDDDSEIKNCEYCAGGKQTRKPFKSSTTQSSKILELIHSDLCGPMETATIGKKSIF